VSSSPKSQIAADVTLALFEVLRHRDRPDEVLKDEDIFHTLPRRLGLSGAVERQLEIQRENTTRGHKLSASELAEFLSLVLRRPDSENVFLDTGARLIARSGGLARWGPRRLRFLVARRRVRRRLDKLFGQRVGGFVSGRFVVETSASPFVQADPSGVACNFVTGLCQQALRDVVGEEIAVKEEACETKGDPSCRWVLANDQNVKNT